MRLFTILQSRLIAIALVGAGALLMTLSGVRSDLLSERALATVRGSTDDFHFSGYQSCSEINAGNDVSKQDCESTPFPKSNVCVFCRAGTYYLKQGMNSDEVVKIKNLGVQDCAGNKFVGTCSVPPPFPGAPNATCILPLSPTGVCDGMLTKYLTQSDREGT